MECGNPGRAGLDRAKLRFPETPQARHAVRPRSLLERVKSCHLALVGSDHKLPALVVADPEFPAERLQERHATYTQARLQRSRRVVEPGVDDARVVTSLVQRQSALLLQHQDLRVRDLSNDQPGGGQPDDPATDDHNTHTRTLSLSPTRKSNDRRLADFRKSRKTPKAAEGCGSGLSSMEVRDGMCSVRAPGLEHSPIWASTGITSLAIGGTEIDGRGSTRGRAGDVGLRRSHRGGNGVCQNRS